MKMKSVSDTKYISENGWHMAREYGSSPSGSLLDGQWVLRDEFNGFVDFDRYRHDLAEKYNIELY